MRNRFFGDPRKKAHQAVVAAELELVVAVAEYEDIAVVDLLGRLGLNPAEHEQAATA